MRGMVLVAVERDIDGRARGLACPGGGPGMKQGRLARSRAP